MRVLMVFCLLVFSIFAFGQRKKIEIKYEIRTDGKKYGRSLGLNFYGDTINKIPVKFISFRDLQAFRNYEFDTIPERCDWKNNSIMIKINQKSKKIPYIKAQGELGENPEDAGVRISTYTDIFNSCVFVYTNMTLLGYEYSKRIASNVKIFDAMGNLIREVTDTTQTMYEHIKMDEDAKFISCVTYTGLNEYGDIQDGIKESSSIYSIYTFPGMNLIWTYKIPFYTEDIGNFFGKYFIWVEKPEYSSSFSTLYCFDTADNSIIKLIYNNKQWYFHSIVESQKTNFEPEGIILAKPKSKEKLSKYFNRDFERLK